MKFVICVHPIMARSLTMYDELRNRLILIIFIDRYMITDFLCNVFCVVNL